MHRRAAMNAIRHAAVGKANQAKVARRRRLWRRSPTLLVVFLALGLDNCHSATEAGTPVASAASPSAGSKPIPEGDFRGVFTRVAQRAMPSVVSIVSERSVPAPQNPFDFFGGMDPFEFFFHHPGNAPGRKPPSDEQSHGKELHETGLGSGFVVNDDGYVLTNNHVVEGAQSLQVQLMDEQIFDAEVVGADKETDLAVIKLKDAPDNLHPLSFGSSEKLQIGEWVVAVGSPFGLRESITSGIVSAKGRQNTGITAYGRFLQTDAAINPGNSGGPLMNLDGEVVGINTAIVSQTGGYQGVGFAIPADLAKTIMNELIKNGKITRGWLGVSIQDISPDIAKALGLQNREGALVSDVLGGGPAEKAGIERGDVIVKINGEEVNDANDLMNRVALIPPGTSAHVTVLRDGKRVRLEVEVGKRKEGASVQGPSGVEPRSALTKYGLRVEDLSDAARQQYEIGNDVQKGALVTEVDPTGSAARAGLREGDVIVEANKLSVTSADAFAKIVDKAPAGKPILLVVSRHGSTFFGALAPPAQSGD